MYRIKKELLAIAGGIRISDNAFAWPAAAIPRVLEAVSHNRWIILGGDVLTPEQKCTCDNWYYEPDRQFSLEENTARSIQKCSEYISDYVRSNGDSFLFVLTISNAYVGATCSC